MVIKILYIFVEGDDDERFFIRIVVPRFQHRYDHVKFVKYAHLTLDKVRNYIKSIDSMPGSDYIFVADKDNFPCITAKKDWIASKYDGMNRSKMLIVSRMIEGWYLAGLSDQSIKRFRLKKPFHTNDVSKEDFEKLMPKRYKSRIDFMIELLADFSLLIACDRNTSLNYVLRKYDLL